MCEAAQVACVGITKAKLAPQLLQCSSGTGKRSLVTSGRYTSQGQ